MVDRTLIVDDGAICLGSAQELLLLPGDAVGALAGHPVVGRLGPAGPDDRAALVDLQMRLPPADVHVLASNVELAMWVEVGTTSFGRQHVVVVRDHLAKAVETAMAALGGSDVARLTRIRLPTGWVAYQRFEPTRLTELPGSLTPLLPSGAQLAHLIGGLPVAARSRVWLTSGPPDVVLPDLAGTPEGTLRVDGQVLAWPADGRLRLHGHALTAGAHELVVGRTLRFTLVDEAVDQDGHGDLRLTVDRRPVEHTFSSSLPTGAGQAGPAGSLSVPVEVTVCGACVSAPGPADQLLAPPARRHIQLRGRYYALGVPGQAAQLRLVAPAWLGQLDPPLYPREADLQTALAEVAFRPSWLLHVPSQGPRTVSSLEELDLGAQPAAAGPAQTGPAQAGAAAWRQAVQDLDLAQAPPGQQVAWQAWLDQDPVPAAPPQGTASGRG